MQSLSADIHIAGCCCSLKDLDFSKGHSPDYRNPQLQKLYILRYYGGYVCEYRLIFREILPFLQGSNIHIATIGAGCRPDLAALHFERLKGASVSYNSYDIVDWYGMQSFPDIASKHTNSCISELDIAKNKFNILLFAKSLSDISTAAYNTFCSNLQSATLPLDKLVVVYSGRFSYNATEIARFKKIVAILKEQGFRTDDDEAKPHSIPEKSAWSSMFPGFTIPPNVASYVSDFAKQCPKRQSSITQNACTAECDRILSRTPTYTTGIVSYNFVRLSR